MAWLKKKSIFSWLWSAVREPPYQTPEGQTLICISSITIQSLSNHAPQLNTLAQWRYKSSRMTWIFSSDQKESRPIFCLRDSVLGFSSSSYCFWFVFYWRSWPGKGSWPFLLPLILLHPTCVRLLPPFFPPTDFFNADLRCIRTCSMCSHCVPDHPEKRYRITMAAFLPQSFYAHFWSISLAKRAMQTPKIEKKNQICKKVFSLLLRVFWLVQKMYQFAQQVVNLSRFSKSLTLISSCTLPWRLIIFTYTTTHWQTRGGLRTWWKSISHFLISFFRFFFFFSKLSKDFLCIKMESRPLSLQCVSSALTLLLPGAAVARAGTIEMADG